MAQCQIYQICPIRKGDPIITFTVDVKNGFVVTGLASGGVDAWPIPSTLGGKSYHYTPEQESKHIITKASKKGIIKSPNIFF